MQQPTENRYSIGATIMQAIVSTLNDLPARQVRGLLNAIEVECLQQDEARAAPANAPLPQIDGGANGN